jgi:hypothetical protein
MSKKQPTKKDLEETIGQMFTKNQILEDKIKAKDDFILQQDSEINTQKKHTQNILNHIGDLLLIDSGKTFMVTSSPYGPVASERQSTLASIAYNIGELHTYRREYCELKDRLLPAAPQIITTSVNKIEGLKGSDN